MIDPDNPWLLLPHTLAANPDAVVAIPVFSPSDPESTLVLKAKRHLRRLPPELAAHLARQEAAVSGGTQPTDLPTHLEVGRVLLTIPADLAENLRGPAGERHVLWLVAVKRDHYDAVKRQTETGIVLPDAANVKGLGIIKP